MVAEGVRWQVLSYLELGALPSAVPCARLHVRHLLWECGLAEVAETAELLVSELTTNAVHASHGLPSPVVRLWLISNCNMVGIAVWDGNRDQLPARQDADPDAERGRGLQLVEAMCTDWGVYQEADGKVVWVTTAAAEQ